MKFDLTKDSINQCLKRNSLLRKWVIIPAITLSFIAVFMGLIFTPDIPYVQIILVILNTVFYSLSTKEEEELNKLLDLINIAQGEHHDENKI